MVTITKTAKARLRIASEVIDQKSSVVVTNTIGSRHHKKKIEGRYFADFWVIRGDAGKQKGERDA
ncbi:MAG: hypothetical protein AAGF88_07905 [Pseudomonadota bacterium]